MAILIVVAVLNAIFTRISFSVNIAKTSKVYYCEMKDREITDISDGNPTTYYKSEGRCSPNPYFDVIFDGEYYVQYVIARESRISSEHTGEMDGFLVDVTMSESRTKQVCGSYPSYLQNPYKPAVYRVNCRQPNKLSNGLHIKFALDTFKEIADIEAHSLTANSEEPLALYRGCFARFPGSMSVLESWTSCLRECRSANHAFAAIKNAIVCGCSNRLYSESELATSKCDVTCNKTADGVEHRCGSADYFTVYRVYLYLPTYYQCMKYHDMLATLDKESKSHPLRVLHNDKNLTIYKCMKYCENVTYALLLNGSTCECSDHDITATLSMDTSCNMACTGNTEDLCGGYNFTSIYITCTNKIYMRCSESLKCNRPMNKYGDCMNDCELGFTGENCAGRDLRLDVKRDCEIDKPCAGKHNVRCILTKNVVECICLDGFSMHSGGHCEDIDECEMAKCDFDTSTCLNMIGSYYCECRDGTYRETNFSCLDNSTDIDGWSFFDGLLLFFLPLLSSAGTVGVYT